MPKVLGASHGRKGEEMSGPMRTDLEAKADRLDCDLYRVLCQVVQASRQFKDAGPGLLEAAVHIRKARPHIRAYMHEHDAEKTA